MEATLTSPHEAVEQVYRDDGDRLWRAVRAYAGSREVADEAVAEAFAQALRRGGALREPGRWIWRAAFRIAAGQLKAGRDRRAAESEEEPYEMDGSMLELLTALRGLSRSQRGAVILHHYAGYPTREVAAILGSTPQAVRIHLMRGRRRLRSLLEVRDD
ncbi:MAG: sigma-70 family RNA polymerase sigma factor [Actinomycetota bacterium]|nr:sigma-70 family RNA polymerase sigma factor [Actinomycetota bacterium]